MLTVAVKCVGRGFRAVGRAWWLQMQEWGYIMAKGYLPDDDTQNMVDPTLTEYNRRHGVS